MGQETSTEGSRDPMTSAVLTCVHAGRRVPQGRMRSGKGGGADQKNGMMGKGDGTEKGVRLGPQNSPRRMGRRGTRGIGRDG